MSRYVLGVDIGSSKTHALVVREDGELLGAGEAGGGNHQTVGYTGLVAALRAASAQALAAAGLHSEQLAAAGLGVSGYDWPSQLPAMLGAVREAGISAPAEVVNDAVLGLVAGAPDLWGLALVSGSGSCCRGRDRHGREGRVAGEGVLFGEYGGGTELAFLSFQAVSRAWSWRGPATSLSEALIAEVGAVDLDDLIEGVSVGRYQVSNRVAPRVFAAARAGDAVAIEILTQLGQGLADMAAGVIRQLALEQEEFPVVLVGSLFKGGPLLTEPLAQALHTVAPGAWLTPLSAPPVAGGGLLALQQLGPVASDTRNRLLERVGAQHWTFTAREIVH
jgi:N-acetylglucosamine kinase-like BadF-type ATPase